MILSIVEYPNQILKNISREITAKELEGGFVKVGEGLEYRLPELLEDMKQIAFDNDGIGIAAPQVGYNVRIFVGRTDAGWMPFINPIIVKRNDTKIVSQEGCLSIKQPQGNIVRNKSIHVEFTTPKGLRGVSKFKDTDAVMIQHEIDHLDGILYFERMTSLARIEAGINI